MQTNAVRNAPMLPGDYISTGKASRAELQFDGYTAVRLGGNAQVRIVSNDPNNRKVQLADGTVEVGMTRDAEAMRVDTPSVSVRAQQAGDVRVSIAADGSSWVTARRGDADVVTREQTYALAAGRTLSARGSASNPSITYGPEVAYDSFDDFNAVRDRAMIAALNASPNLIPNLAGYENLNDYGHWDAVAGYGRSWVPNEPAGWVPYRNGSWTWEGGYGWTWVGSEPWGWTPYHYGNWYYCSCGSSGWAWLPPSAKAAQTWSPALVGFFGFDVAATGGPNNCGGNYGYAPSSSGGAPAAYANEAPAAPASNAAPAAPNTAPAPYGEGGPSSPESPYGEGGPGYPAQSGYPYPYIGWVPVAPYEPFYPWYPGWAWLGFGWGYGYPAGFGTNIVSVTNIYNITRIYRNFRHGGATGTPIRHFRHGTVHGHTVAVTPRDIGRRFGTIHGALPIKPTRNNLAFSRGTVRAPVTFSKAFNSPRFTLHGTPVARASVAHAPVGRHANAPVARVNAPVTRANAAMAHAAVPETRANAFRSRGNVPVTRENPSFARENAAASRQIEAARRGSAPVTRENTAPVTRENAAPATREAPRSAFAPSASWERFSTARGEARSAEFPGGSGGATSSREMRGSEVSAPGEAGRGVRAPSDSWGRFSTSRGESYGGTRGESYGGSRGQSYGGMRGQSYGGMRGESYGGTRDPYADRQSMPSYPRAMPSYSRGSYGSPYSRESYPSYSRGSYPSYPRGSYSAPAYPRGSAGSAPTYPRGGWAPPRSSGGGGGGGGGARRGGGGRPPH
ncbi:MAG TPA: DUF6600 domain-containing protein [Candidatus Cybelea sp.]